MMVGWSSFAVKGLWALRDNIYEFVCVSTVAMLSWSFAVLGFLALWNNNITVVMVIKGTCSFLYAALWNNARTQTVHSTMACYVHVLLYNSAKYLCVYVLSLHSFSN
jgi:hypothetical protein